MADTLRKYHPDAALTVLLLDADPGEVEGLVDAQLLGMESVLGESYGLSAAANPPGALGIAVLPRLMRVLIESSERSAIFLGPGQRLLGPLNELVELLDEHEVVLVARPTSSPNAVAAPADARTGAFSRQFLGLRAGRSTDALLSAWPLYFKGIADDGSSAVRTWMESIPALVEDVGVLRHHGYGLDPWSLASVVVQRSTPADADELGLEVDGVPARALDLSELDPSDQVSWFAGPERVRLSSAPALAELVERQAAELRAAGLSSAADVGAPYMQLGDGLALSDTVRSLLLAAILAREVTRSPFSGAGRSEFYQYLNQLDGRGRGAGLTRLHMAIWERRADLRDSYPHIDGPDGVGFAGWLCLHGVEQEGLVSELLPPAPELAYRDADPHLHEDRPRWGANVVGFFTAELGVGEAARLLIAGLDAGSVPALPIQGQLIPPSRQGHDFAHAGIDEAAYPINILCINGDGVSVFAREAGRSFFEGRYTIALWFWEVGDPPPSWSQAYEFIDEVWVASQHVYDVIAPTSPIPVVKTRLPVAMPDLARRGHAELGLPERGFLFLYAYDYHSVAARKNPLGLIEAFRRAFPTGGGAQLVLKSINAESCAGDHERVVLAAKGRDDITLLDDYVSSGEKNAMIAACDCYVSLHRSEGLGLTVAEAMLLGKPVIATRYGGTLEFTNDENSYLVRWEPAAVGEGAYPYAPDAIWAEPDLDHAAALMRHVLDHPQEARERGLIARRDVLDHHSPAVAGAAIGRRLALVNERLYQRGARSLNLAHLPSLTAGAKVQMLIESLPTINWGGGRLGRLRWRAQRPVADWSRAYVEHESKIDIETQLSLGRLDACVRDLARELHDQQNAHHAETLAALRRLQASQDAAAMDAAEGSAPADASSEHAQRGREAPAEGSSHLPEGDA
jgi:glycosyltransferase involved in cell wall biosynthesis